MQAPVDASSAITGYHAHVYYDAGTRAAAAQLREAIGARFKSVLGRWHDNPVGPHPTSMYQVAFPVEEFPRLVPWLMLNRGDLVILVHPLTGDDYEDHAHHAVWLGAKLPLKLETLIKGGTAIA
ncbi:MAG TPA: DOPA 4,5-dioxygenase family protein [Stellaceae bacterium]|nr:DOPA 4,5-dioxygenase family protein [Stellaceae bacterium]